VRRHLRVETMGFARRLDLQMASHGLYAAALGGAIAAASGVW
jgi:hypothetical protein